MVIMYMAVVFRKSVRIKCHRCLNDEDITLVGEML